MYWKNFCQQFKWGNPFPLLSTGEVSSGHLCPVLGFAVQETWMYRRKSSEGPAHMVKGLWGKAEICDCSALRREGSRGILSTSISTWREVQRRESQALSSGMSTDRTRVNGQRVEHIKFPLNIRKHFFYCKCDWPLAHIAQGDGDISVLGDIQKQHGYSPG